MPPPPSCDAQDVVPPPSACWSFRRWAEATTSAPTRSSPTPGRAYPSINPSTVYRTLDALVDAGIARRTDLGSGRLFYEVAREHRHHHAVCQECGAVAHIHDASLGPLADALRGRDRLRADTGPRDHHPGICPDCQSTASIASGDDGKDTHHAHP